MGWDWLGGSAYSGRAEKIVRSPCSCDENRRRYDIGPNFKIEFQILQSVSRLSCRIHLHTCIQSVCHSVTLTVTCQTTLV